MIDRNTLKELIEYNPVTGEFIRRVNVNKHKAGELAGTVCSHGRLNITINGKRYKAHRLAFLYMLGYFPVNDVDHINGNPLDNRWMNLRPVTHAENQMNLGLSKNNSSGVIGVYFRKRDRAWVSAIQVVGKTIHLYHGKCFEEACRSRKQAEAQYGFHANHGRAV